ncbi:MAG: CocE/NonD family hydrolase [Candidatus Hodarchaeota archaeon]
MIDIIIALFLQLDTAGIISVHQFLSNLILILISRVVYLVTSYLSWQKNGERNLKEAIKNDPKSSFFFILPHIGIILSSMLFFLLCIFLSIYSLLMSGLFIKRYAKKTNSADLNNIGELLIVLIPIISVYRFLITQDYYALATVALTLLFFFLFGQKEIYTRLREKIRLSTVRVYRISQLIYGGIIILLILIPSVIAIGAIIYVSPPKQKFMVEMRDGTLLATDLYITPSSFGAPRTVILIRTPYGKSSMIGFRFLYSTQRYHMVIQDLRGTGGSGDNETYIMFQRDYQDGVDTIDWILNQSWCNGKIATIGLSALAINAFMFAGMNPAGLTVQSLVVGTPDLYEAAIFPGGVFREALVTEWIKSTSPWNMDFQLSQLIGHSKKDSYYNTTSLSMTPGPTFQNVNVPALHVGGWYDCFQQGTLNGYMGYDDFGGTGAKGKQLLIMGPFTHGFPRDGTHGELTFPTKRFSTASLYFDWETKLFDHVLLGKDFDWTGNRVAYYMMGDIEDNSEDINDYRFATDWPIPGYEDVFWYLTDTSSLQIGNNGIKDRNFSYIFDPRDPVPTLGGTNLVIANGPYDQSILEDRDDILLFETPPLTEKVEIVGRMWAHLWVMSNCSNTDFTVKITDVYPDGRSMLITDGIINAIRRNGFNIDAPALNSSGPTEVIIDLWSTAYQFNVGHKIRIAISSSNYPRFAINPNTGASQELYSYQYLNRFIANNTILVGPSFPSYLIFPKPPS